VQSKTAKGGEAVAVEMREALLPLVRLAATLSADIKEYDKKIEELGREKYGHTALLRQVKGVGPITALAYVLTLENPERFVKSRDVGPYLGLVPNQEDSGESQPQLGISKAGDTMVRKLLVGARSTSWGRSDRTRTYDGMDCGYASAEGRMRRSERRSRWHGSWRCYCTGCG
jgi:transposase